MPIMQSKKSVWSFLDRIYPLSGAYDVAPIGLKWRSNTGFIVFTVGVGMFSDLLLFSLIVPVLPYMLRDRIGTPEDQLQSITSMLLSIFAFASMIASPIAGYLSDTFASSRQAPFLLGLIVLTAATILLAFGQSVAILTLARFLQGASSGIVWTVGLAMCLETVGPDNMGKVVGSIFSVLTAGTLFAPTLGGLLYEKTGYTGVFGVAVGILVIDFILRLLVIEKKIARRYLASSASSSGTATPVNDETTTADEESALLPKPPDEDFILPPLTWKLLQKVPILACLRNISLLVALLIGIVQAFFISTFDATVPLIAIQWFDYSPLRAGLLFLPLGVADLIVGPPAGWAIDRFGTKPAAILGFSILVISFGLLNIPQPGGSVIVFCVVLGLSGIGLSIAGTPSIVEAGEVMEKYHKANPELFGENGPYAQLYGMTSMTFSLGLTVGPAIAGTLKDTIGYGNMASIMAVIALLMAIISGCYVGRPLPPLKALWPFRKRIEA